MKINVNILQFRKRLTQYHATYQSNLSLLGEEVHVCFLQRLESFWQKVKDILVTLLLFELCLHTVKLGNKELFDKEQIGIKEPFLVTNLAFTS